MSEVRAHYPILNTECQYVFLFSKIYLITNLSRKIWPTLVEGSKLIGTREDFTSLETEPRLRTELLNAEIKALGWPVTPGTLSEVTCQVYATVHMNTVQVTFYKVPENTARVTLYKNSKWLQQTDMWKKWSLRFWTLQLDKNPKPLFSQIFPDQFDCFLSENWLSLVLFYKWVDSDLKYTHSRA